MNIYVDADACPGVIRDILCRVAKRQQLMVHFVANRLLQLPASVFIKSVRVADGFDEADNEIVRLCQPGDLIVSADIPLAAEGIDKGALVLSPRGELFTPENIRQRLNMRDFMDTLRSSGIQHGGPPPLGQKERKDFADNLDRILAKRIKP